MKGNCANDDRQLHWKSINYKKIANMEELKIAGGHWTVPRKAWAANFLC